MKQKIYEKGITLIALVITIIVLLILAGVTINIVINQGIIDKSQTAVDEYKILEYKDNIEIIKTGEHLKKIANKLSESLKDLVVEKLESKENENWVKKVETSEEDAGLEENQIKVITKDKYIIIAEIEEDGKITYITIERDNGEPYPSLEVKVLPLEGTENEKVKIQVKAEVEKIKNTKKIAKIELILGDTVIETRSYNELKVEDIFEVEENGTYRIKAITDQGKSTSKKAIVNIQGTENVIQITSELTTSRNTESIGTKNGVETGPITVTIEYGETELQKQYKVGTEDWQTVGGTSTQIQVTENISIVAKYTDGTNSFKSTTYNVQNVDNVAPNAFSITATSTTNSITVTASTEDTASVGSATGIEGILRYEYRIDNGSWQNNEGEFINLPTGTYKVQAKAIDKAGNERISTNIETVELGTISTADITINSTPTTARNTENTGTQNGVEKGPITVTITYGKSNYTKQYKVGSGSWQTVTETTKTINVTENTTIVARYYDGTNGFETENYNVQNVDNVAPTFTSYDATVNGAKITASATATDTASIGAATGIAEVESVKYSIDGTSYQTTNTFTISAAGNYIIYMKAIDKAGNETIVNKTVTVNQYTINFNANGGTVSETSKTVIQNTEYGGLPTPTRTGYTFAGWYTSSTGGTEITSTTIANITADQTLYAHWTSKNYTLTIKHYLENANDTNYTLSTTTTSSVAYGTNINLADYKTTITNGTYGYGSLTDSISGGTAITSTTMGEDTIICLYYSRNTYTLTLLAGTYIDSVTGGGTYKVGQSVIIDATLSKNETGYTVSWSEWISNNTSLLSNNSTQNATITMPAGNVTLTANATGIAKTYTITYNANGGTSAPASQTKTYGVDLTLSSTVPYYTNATFLGWAETNDATTATYQPGDNYTANEDVILYAIWGITFTNGPGIYTEKGTITSSAKIPSYCTITITYSMGGYCSRGVYVTIDGKDLFSASNENIYEKLTFENIYGTLTLKVNSEGSTGPNTGGQANVYVTSIIDRNGYSFVLQ